MSSEAVTPSGTDGPPFPAGSVAAVSSRDRLRPASAKSRTAASWVTHPWNARCGSESSSDGRAKATERLEEATTCQG